MTKVRLDNLIVDLGLAVSRSQAQAMIMAGSVKVGDKVIDKAGTMVALESIVAVKDQPQYVSRAGNKLASVSDSFKLDFVDKIVLDVGSSTGGFTDFALQHGALKVYAVDVGRNQLAYKLREDPRVVSMERTDIRVAKLPEPVDVAVVDVSFISLRSVLMSVAAWLKPKGLIVAMAKPQFEAGKSIADRFEGVIADEKVRQEILAGLRAWLDDSFTVEAEADSLLRGAKGNLEHFYVLRLKPVIQS